MTKNCQASFLSMKKYVLLLSVFLFTCTENKHSLLNEIDDSGEVKAVEINHEEEIRLFGDDLSFFSDLIIIDSLLIVNKLLPNPYFYTLYDLKNKRSILSFGRQGQGPGEFSSFSTASVLSFKNRVLELLVPNEGGVVYSVKIDSLMLGDYAAKRSAMLGYGPGHFIRKDDMYFVTEKAGRISMTDSMGNVLESGLKFPFEDTNLEIPRELLNRAYEGQLIKQPQGDRAAIATLNSPNFDIFALSQAISPLKSIHIAAPKIFDESGDLAAGGRMTSISFSEMTPMGFLDISANKDHIYLLYSGKTYKEYGDDAEYSDLVYMLDWDGNFVSEIKLDHQTRQLVTDEKGDYLYTLVETENEYYLRKQSLKSVK